jgi:hypothetical protein
MHRSSQGDVASPVRPVRARYPELAPSKGRPRRPRGLPPAMLWPDWTDGHRYAPCGGADGGPSDAPR